MTLIDSFVSQHEGQARHLQLTSSRDKSSFHQNRKILVGTRLFLQHTLLQSLTSLSPMGILTFQHFNKGLFFSFGRCQGFLSVGNFLRLVRRTLFSVLYGSRTSGRYLAGRSRRRDLVQQVCPTPQEEVMRESPAAIMSAQGLTRRALAIAYCFESARLPWVTIAFSRAGNSVFRNPVADPGVSFGESRLENHSPYDTS